MRPSKMVAPGAHAPGAIRLSREVDVRRGREEEQADQVREALAAVEAALAADGAARRAALPRVLSYDVARRLEQELRTRGLVGARYRDEPRDWGDLWDRLETVMGLDEDEPRAEWDEVEGRDPDPPRRTRRRT
jgi:hypothetical protein